MGCGASSASPPAAAATHDPAKQSAFVFIKPHANTPAVAEMVKAKFDEVGITVLSEGTYDGPTIDKKKYIDQQYGAEPHTMRSNPSVHSVHH